SDQRLVSPEPRTHCPDFEIPMGTTSYLLVSMAANTPAAVTQLTACSLDRPPNSTATRGFGPDGWASGARACGDFALTASADKDSSDTFSYRLRTSVHGPATAAQVHQRKVCLPAPPRQLR